MAIGFINQTHQNMYLYLFSYKSILQPICRWAIPRPMARRALTLVALCLVGVALSAPIGTLPQTTATSWSHAAVTAGAHTAGKADGISATVSAGRHAHATAAFSPSVDDDCPNKCSGHGVCTTGTCACNVGYGNPTPANGEGAIEDCSMSAYDAPPLSA